MSLPPVDEKSLVCSTLVAQVFDIEHLSDACRTSKTVDLTTDRVLSVQPAG